MKNVKLTVEDQLDALQVKISKLRPIPRQVLDPAARVLDCLDRGEDLVAVKYFQGAGQEYQPGQTVDTSGWGRARLGQMGAVGYILPASEYQQAIEYNAARDLVENKLTPVKTSLSMARQNAQKAGERVAAAAAELATAQQQARDAAGQVEYWQNELDQALKGEDVRQVLGITD